MPEHATAAVVGLGSMGFGIAQSLLRAGHVVHGVDLDEGAMARFREEGGAEEDAAVAKVYARNAGLAPPGEGT